MEKIDLSDSFCVYEEDNIEVEEIAQSISTLFDAIERVGAKTIILRGNDLNQSSAMSIASSF